MSSFLHFNLFDEVVVDVLKVSSFAVGELPLYHQSAMLAALLRVCTPYAQLCTHTQLLL